MTCEEFEAIGLEFEAPEGLVERDAKPLTAVRAAALEHLSACPRCAALQNSWEEARQSLRAWGQATRNAAAPSRVEMRLRQEFRTRHGTLRKRKWAIFSAWTLATAALLIALVSWWNWHLTQRQQTSISAANSANSGESAGVQAASPEDSADSSTLVADAQGDFSLLPGSLPEEAQDGAILRVRMQRGTLADLGVPVNEEGASDWVQVDLLVGEDGQPRAVRLPSETGN